MKDNFSACLAITLKYEGGYSNHPSDPGGATMRGVTQAVYDSWRRKHSLLPRPVRQIAQNELEAIYRHDYWDRCKCDDLPSGVDLAVWDYAVNSGTGRAIKALQSVVGVAADGIVGPATISAAKAHPGAAGAICDARLAFVRRLKTYPVFGKGWAARISDVKKRSLAMAKAAPHVEEETTVFDDIADVIDWTRHPKETTRQVPPPTAYTDDALHRYVVPALVAFLGALAAQPWNDALSDHPTVSISMIFIAAASAAYQAAAPAWLRWIYKGPTAHV